MSEQDVFDALKYHIEVDSYGHRFYYNNAGEWHRENGPAIISERGDKYWYQNNRLHRTDGPAVEYSYGGKDWFINGKKLTEAEFNQKVKLL